MRSLEQLQTGKARELWVRWFLIPGKARQRVPEDNPIKAFKCHIQDANAGTLKAEIVSGSKEWECGMMWAPRYKSLGRQPGSTSQTIQIKVLGPLFIFSEMYRSNRKGRKVNTH